MQEDGARMIIADTEANNQGAISFFKALGFSQRRQHVWLAKTLKRPGKKVREPGGATTIPIQSLGTQRKSDIRRNNENEV